MKPQRSVSGRWRWRWQCRIGNWEIGVGEEDSILGL